MTPRAGWERVVMLGRVEFHREHWRMVERLLMWSSDNGHLALLLPYRLIYI